MQKVQHVRNIFKTLFPKCFFKNLFGPGARHRPGPRAGAGLAAVLGLGNRPKGMKENEINMKQIGFASISCML